MKSSSAHKNSLSKGSSQTSKTGGDLNSSTPNKVHPSALRLNNKNSQPIKQSIANIKPLTKQEKKILSRKKQPRWKRWLKRIFFTVLILITIGIIGIICVFAWFAQYLPSTDGLENRVLAESTKIYDRTGERLLYETGKDVRRTYIKIDDISSYLQQATIAVEDKNFYSHHGFDPLAILRSAGINVASDKQVGGSTITQQFVKLAMTGNDRTYSRKIKELILSVELERKYEKNKILEFYLNEAGYGGINVGVAAAAETYFDAIPKDLTLAQAAFLAAIPQSPRRVTQDYEALLERKDFVLDRMTEENYITADEAKNAKAEPIELERSVIQKEAPHFVDYVLAQLEDDFGGNFINQGLRVTTTLDLDKQALAESAIHTGMTKVEQYGGSNAALVSLDAHTGQILALVGSKDYYSEDYDGQVNVALSPRQPGSSFKPIVYATAFANGYNPNTILFDVETDFPIDSGNYHPRNFSLGTSGPLTMRRALGQSLNIPAVKTLYLTGKDKVLDTAEALGYTTLSERDRFGLALALGGGEVKLLEHTAAFATFAREGERHPVTSILKVTDRAGNVLSEWSDHASQALDKAAVQQLNNVLSDQGARAGFSALNVSGKTIAGKTGTTNDFHDAWTIMYTPSFVTGVWTGNNDNTAMKYMADGIIIAAPIANDYMSHLLEGLPDESFNSPPKATANKPVLAGQIGETIEKYVDKSTQHIIPDECVNAYPETFKEKKEFKEIHTILYYLRKEDPLGSPPENPNADPMFTSWEKAVTTWAEGQPDYLTEKTEYEDCNLRSPDQTPTIYIVSPSEGEKVTNKTFGIETRLDPGTHRSIKKIEYIIDKTTVEVLTSQPFVGHYKPTTLTTGNHTLTVRITNDRDNVAEDTINFNYSTAATETNNNNENSNTDNTNNSAINNSSKNNSNSNKSKRN